MRVAVFDLGKTHARVVICDLDRGQEVAARQMRNRIRPGPPYPHHDVAAQEAFLRRALAELGPVDAVLPVAHGATIALTDGRYLVLPVLDYEHPLPADPAYDAARPPFAVTGTPRMPQGLNLGAQLFWLRQFPEFARVTQMLFWPQFWSWRLCGVAAAEVAYASGHGDLWDLGRNRPVAGPIGDLLRLPPIRRAGEVLGAMPDGTKVLNGAHDSSLALTPWAGPCTVLSSGTWLTAFAIGAGQVPRAAGPAVMASLDLHGRLVPNFRLMAGRAFDLLSQPQDLPQRPAEALRLSDDFRLLDDQGRACDLIPGNRAEQLGALIAARTHEGLAQIGARGPLHLTGPLAANLGFTAAFPGVTLHDYGQSLCQQVAALLAQV